VRQRLQLLACACLLAACGIAPSQVQPGRGDTALQQAADFSALVASRSATVVDISTLRIGRDESEGDMNLEFAPERDFADRLAAPLPARVQISEIRDLASGIILASDGLIRPHLPPRESRLRPAVGHLSSNRADQRILNMCKGDEPGDAALRFAHAVRDEVPAIKGIGAARRR
jgi:hypothetical protein